MQYPNNLLIFFNKSAVLLKIFPQAKPLFTGIPVKLEEDVYALFKKSIEIYRNTVNNQQKVD